MHILSKTKKSQIPKKLLFFDSESYVDTSISNEEIQKKLNNNDASITKEHDLYLICSTYVNYKTTKKDNEELRDFHISDDKNIIKSFWEYVDSKINNKEKLLIFAHNAKYDVIQTSCVPELINQNYKVWSFADSNPFIMTFRKRQCSHCKSYNVTDELENEEDIDEDEASLITYCVDCEKTLSNKEILSKTIQILSSTNYYQTTLKKLGECFGIEKLDFEYGHGEQTKEEEITYCRQDVLILKTAMLKFIEFVKQENLGSFKQTIAGQAFNAYRQRFMQQDLFIHRDKLALISERMAYSGGRTEMWKMGKYENLFYIDINAMYPSLMINKKMPTRMVQFRKNMELRELRDWIKRGFLITCKCTVNTNENVYMKKEKRLIFPTGEFETYLNTPEIEYSLEHKHLKKISNVCVYEGEVIFKDYVEFFYNKRLEARAKNDEVNAYLLKLFMNALYGKFGQRNIKWDKIADAPIEECHSGFVEIRDEKGKTEYFLQKTFGGGVFKERNLPLGENESKNSFPSIAGHVTSYARMMLWEYIKLAGKENVYYMDTDSLFTNDKGYQKMLENNCIDPKTLGKMKLECFCETAEFRGVKDYTFTFKDEKSGELKTKETIKGISKASVKIDDNTYACLRWDGMSSYIKEGKISNYSNKLMIKKLKREYTKGNISPAGNVKPFEYIKNERIE